jgi:predicted nucleotidyltransferase
MVQGNVARLDGLPTHVDTVLKDFVGEAQEALGGDLVSAVLFGSAADGRMKATSDVNLILVLGRFDPEKLARLSDALLTAEAAIQLHVMFLLESEIQAAVECFAQKFADILRRHRVIFGKDVFADTVVPRGAEIFRLRQILLNLTLRLRQVYVARGERAEQVAHVLADIFGAVRASVATLLELEGHLDSDSDTALTTVAKSFGVPGEAALASLVAAHERKPLAEPRQALVQVIDFLSSLSARAAKLT